jgi:polyisoprenyl-phosphate glycosyltransferase
MRGEVTICMDADLQDPPELVPELVRRWQEGFDVVYVVRRRREPVLKRVANRLFYLGLLLVSENAST